jgi:hypothetical protein
VGYHRCIDNGESKMDTMENQDTIRRIYQALQTGDLSVFSASVHFGRSSNGRF